MSAMRSYRSVVWTDGAREQAQALGIEDPEDHPLGEAVTFYLQSDETLSDVTRIRTEEAMAYAYRTKPYMGRALLVYFRVYETQNGREVAEIFALMAPVRA